MRGHDRVAKFLVANKADITVRDEDGDTPLKKAFLKGHVLTFFNCLIPSCVQSTVNFCCKFVSVDLLTW
jgi:ankyrin repeat protein